MAFLYLHLTYSCLHVFFRPSMLVSDVLVGCYGETHHVPSSPQLLIRSVDTSGLSSMLLF
jgi:hypothetical protein